MNIKVTYGQVTPPAKDGGLPVMLTDETMQLRKKRVLQKMRERGLEQLIIYDDVEHAGNFNYLVGFYTRFEEALLVMNAGGEMTLMLGNENLNKAVCARFPCRAVHVSLFSLPNQPNRGDKTLAELFLDAGIRRGQRVGLVGWKHFTSPIENGKKMYDMPSYIVNAITEIVADDDLVSNESDLFIGDDGVRTVNNANEIAHYEYGAALASDCMLDAMNRLKIGASELELGDALQRYGQHTSVTTIAAAGKRMIKGNLFPTERCVISGVPVSLTVGYAGGLSSRAGYAVHDASELPPGAEKYLEELAIPYYNAYTAWLKTIHIGMTGGELYDTIECVLPKAVYHWSLCPGHLVAEEEWLSSPVYENSLETLKSGMIFQIDIIPGKPGMAGVCAESTVVLADERLKREIAEQYPDMWQRMRNRLTYLRQELKLVISDDVLPMCSTVAYLRPYLLNHFYAMKGM